MFSASGKTLALACFVVRRRTGVRHQNERLFGSYLLFPIVGALIFTTALPVCIVVRIHLVRVVIVISSTQGIFLLSLASIR